MAGVKSESAFYKKFPTQEAFMKVHGKEFKKAQSGWGGAIGGVPQNYNNPLDPSAIGQTSNWGGTQGYQSAQNYYGDNSTGFQSDFRQIQPIGGNMKPAGLFKSPQQLPTAQQLQGKGSGAMDAINKFAGPIGELAQGYSALRGERAARKEAQQNLAISDVTRKASATREEQSQRKYVRPEDIQNTGEEFFPIYGVGTNVLSKNGSNIYKAQNGFDGEDANDDLINKYPTYTDRAKTMGPEEAPAGYKEESKFDTNSARDTWVNKTGRPWSEAKKLGYTTGSAKDNIKLLSELNDPRFKKENLRDSAPSKGTASRTPVQHRETPSGRLTAIKPSQSYAEAMKGKPKYAGNQGDINTPYEGTTFNRMGERLANPVQTLGNYSKYGEAPAEGFSKNSKNAYDQVLGFGNPAYWANAIGNAVDYASEGEYRKAAIEALDALPAIGKIKYTKDLPYLMGLPEGRAAGQRAAGYLGEGATRVTGPASKQIGRGIAKQLKQPFTPNFTMYQNGGGIGGNPTEIQNTYDDGNDIYTDMGYEPLNDSFQQKSFQGGGMLSQFTNQFKNMSPDAYGQLGHMATGAGQALTGGQNAGGQIGGTIGKTAGNLIGGPLGGAIGEFVGGTAGNLLDTNAKKINKFNKGTEANTTAMAFNSGMQGLQQEHNVNVQNGGDLQPYEEGGWVSHDWQPQVIASFGDHSAKDVYDFAHEGMDSLRAGGHLREYTPPSERAMEIYEDGGQVNSYAMGGQLKTHWGGEAETVSHNPYLPGSGETVAFRGQSHTESDGNGKTGIGITYGNNPVEVERGEPMFEMQAGGEVNPETGEPENTGVVFGNMEVNKNIAGQFNDPELMAIADKYHGKKFKNIGLDLSKDEARQNKIMTKNTDALTSLKVTTPFDKLKMSSYKANLEGADKKLKELANTKIMLANYQNAINDAKDEISEGVGKNISAEHLAKGLIQLDRDPVTRNAKWGDTISKLADGGKTPKFKNEADAIAKGYTKTPKGWAKVTKGTTTTTPETTKIIPGTPGAKGSAAIPGKKYVPNENAWWKSLSPEQKAAHNAKVRAEIAKDPAYKDIAAVAEIPATPEQIIKTPGTSASTPDVTEYAEIDEPTKFPWQGYANQALNYLRPSDQEAMDYGQYYPEWNAMASNQLEPVPSQRYQPELNVPYDISLQAQRNAVIGATRGLTKQLGYNPAAQANAAPAEYNALNEINQAEFQANQAMKDRVYSGNRATMNQAQMTNLGLAADQWGKQALAKSNTKATTQAAISSMADKYAKHKLENRTLGVNENMYNYRFGKSGKAQNWNPLQVFNTEVGGGKGASSNKGLAEGKGFTYDENGNIVGVRALGKGESSDDSALEAIGGIKNKNGSNIKKNQKNSSVVRAYKNL